MNETNNLDMKEGGRSFHKYALVTGITAVLFIAVVGLVYYLSIIRGAQAVNENNGQEKIIGSEEGVTNGTQAIGTIASVSARYPYKPLSTEERCLETDMDMSKYVDIESYTRMKQTLLPANPKEVVYGCPTIQSLYILDIERDGNEEILGFVHYPNIGVRSATSTALMLWRYVMSSVLQPPSGPVPIWKQGVSFHKEQIFQFDIYDTDDLPTASPCKLGDISGEKIVVRCTDSTDEYTYILNKQGDGTYARDMASEVVVHSHVAGWNNFQNERWGLSFNYPLDVQISEQTYQDGTSTVSILQATRNGKTLFDILDMASNEYMSSSGDVFLKLSDSSYLTRETRRLSQERLRWKGGVFYFQADIPTYGEHYKKTFGNYLLFSELRDEKKLKEVDNIFASLKPAAISAEQKTTIVPVPNNTLRLGSIASIEIPGFLLEQSQSNPDHQNSLVILNQSKFRVRQIPSEVYNDYYFSVTVYPFGSVGTTSNMWNGKYDAVNDSCEYSEYVDWRMSVPKEIGRYRVCPFGYGDGGSVIAGYHVIDPLKKYITTIFFSGEAQAERFGWTFPTEQEREVILKSFRFIAE